MKNELKPEKIIDSQLLSSEDIKKISDETFLTKLKRITPVNTNDPTHTPQSFQEQFYFQAGGNLWVYMSGVWCKFIKDA